MAERNLPPFKDFERAASRYQTFWEKAQIPYDGVATALSMGKWKSRGITRSTLSLPSGNMGGMCSLVRLIEVPGVNLLFAASLLCTAIGASPGNGSVPESTLMIADFEEEGVLERIRASAGVDVGTWLRHGYLDVLVMSHHTNNFDVYRAMLQKGANEFAFHIVKTPEAHDPYVYIHEFTVDIAP